MIAQEDYLVIHKLHALGYTITQIARELGLDRKTVRSHLARDHPPQYQRTQRPSKLDPYRNWIRTRLEAAPLTATRLLRELRPLGYTGGYSILKAFVAEVRPRPPVPVVVRFETPPGDHYGTHGDMVRSSHLSRQFTVHVRRGRTKGTLPGKAGCGLQRRATARTFWYLG